MTHIAILHSSNENIENSILSKLANVEDISIHIYSKERHDTSIHGKVDNVEIPLEYSTLPKMLNFIIDAEKSYTRNGRYLHIILDEVKIIKDPTSFIKSLQLLMQSFNLQSWLSTIRDPMNYVYKKYNPRIQVDLDADAKSKTGLSEVLFTSHANTYWMCFDLDADISKLKFNEKFTIPMYYIIEFLARRRAAAGKCSLDFMNMYPTVKDEVGLFDVVQAKQQDYSSLAEEEHRCFEELKLDIKPTNNIDMVLENMYNILKDKNA